MVLISVKCEMRYWRSGDLPAIQIVGRTNWGRVTPRGAICGWTENCEYGAFVTRFYDCERGKKNYSQTARDSIIAAIPASKVECIDPHFSDPDLEDPLNFCRGVYDVSGKDDRARGVVPSKKEYPAMNVAENWEKLGDRGCCIPANMGYRGANPNACLLCMAIEQKRDEAYIAALWNPYSPDGKAEWIYRGSLVELRARQSEIRAAEAESASEYADGAASYLARVKAWLDAHVMESYARENVPLMSDEEAEAWRIRMVTEAAKATPWADPSEAEAEAEAPKKRRRKAEEEVVAV